MPRRVNAFHLKQDQYEFVLDLLFVDNTTNEGTLEARLRLSADTLEYILHTIDTYLKKRG